MGVVLNPRGGARGRNPITGWWGKGNPEPKIGNEKIQTIPVKGRTRREAVGVTSQLPTDAF